MVNVDAYRAELDYRRESVRRALRPWRERRAAKEAARNRIASSRTTELGA